MASGEVRGGTVTIANSSASTTGINNLLTIDRQSTGTAGATFGASIEWRLESSTTPSRTAATLSALWDTATDASRKGRFVLAVYDTAAREIFDARANGSVPTLGFFGATPVARQSLPAAATDAATTMALANAIRATLIARGLND